MQLLLADDEWQQGSDREIVRRCQVDHKVVSRVRTGLSGAQPQIDRKVERGDSVYEMKAPPAKSSVMSLMSYDVMPFKHC